MALIVRISDQIGPAAAGCRAVEDIVHRQMVARGKEPIAPNVQPPMIAFATAGALLAIIRPLPKGRL